MKAGSPTGGSAGRRGRDGETRHCPVRDVILSAPRLVSLHATVAGNDRIVETHDWAVGRAFARIDEHAAQTWMRGKTTQTMVRTGFQKTVPTSFPHNTSRNLEPQLPTHCVTANMV